MKRRLIVWKEKKSIPKEKENWKENELTPRKKRISSGMINKINRIKDDKGFTHNLPPSRDVGVQLDIKAPRDTYGLLRETGPLPVRI